MKLSIFLTLVLFMVASHVQAAEAEAPKTRRELNFEGEVVEGAARQSMDSLTQTANGAKKNDTHLYDKREKNQDRNSERVREIVETY